MPLPRGNPIGTSIKELHKGKTYARTKAKFGKAKADRQAVAIAERVAGAPKPRKKKRNG